jgi:hypothetical protein
LITSYSTSVSRCDICLVSFPFQGIHHSRYVSSCPRLEYLYGTFHFLSSGSSFHILTAHLRVESLSLLYELYDFTMAPFLVALPRSHFSLSPLSCRRRLLHSFVPSFNSRNVLLSHNININIVDIPMRMFNAGVVVVDDGEQASAPPISGPFRLNPTSFSYVNSQNYPPFDSLEKWLCSRPSIVELPAFILVHSSF